MFNFKKHKHYKEQRDRFLAYAFASADLFIEIDADGTIVYATGAVKTLTGIDHEDLPGKKWLTLFEPKHHSFLMDIKKKATPGLRQGPFLINLNKNMSGRQSILTSIKLPNSKHFYITIGLSNTLLNELSKLMAEHEDGPMLTGFVADDLSHEDPITTDFTPEDGDTEPLETGFIAEDIKHPDSLTTGIEPDDHKEPDALTTDIDPDDHKEPDTLTTGFEADNEKDTPLETGFVAEDQTETALETGFVADDHKDADALTTGFTADPQQEETALETGFVAEDIKDTKAMTTGFTADDISEEKGMTTGFVATDDDAPEALTTGFTADTIGLKDTLEERSEFQSEAKRVFHYAQRNNLSASMTVFNFGNMDAIPEENQSEIIERITEMMRHESLADCPPSQIKPNTFSLLHNSDKKMEKFKERIIEASKKLDPAGEGIEVTIKTIDANLDQMTSDEAVRALMHTIQAIQDNKGGEIAETLVQNMQTLVTTNSDKLNEFKAIIDRVDFNINFQPVVKTKNGEADHYEVLCRVNNGDIGDWVMFGEDNGMAPEFDLAVLERTMNYIHFKAGTTRTRFSVNISSKSIEDPKFAEKFHGQLSRRDLSERMLIEINNPRSIKNFSHLLNFVVSLNELDYPVTLDHITFEESLLVLLEQIDVAYIKTNSKHLKRLYEEPESKKMVDDILALCKKQSIKTIGQFVEEQEQVDFLNEIGVPCAQGYLFGHAEPAPKFIPPTR